MLRKFALITAVLPLAVLFLLRPGSSIVSRAALGPLVGPVLYGVTSDNTGELFSIDPATGAATDIGDTLYDSISAIAFRPSTGVLYAIGQDPANNEANVLLTLNLSTGAGTAVGLLGVNN